MLGLKESRISKGHDVMQLLMVVASSFHSVSKNQFALIGLSCA